MADPSTAVTGGTTFLDQQVNTYGKPSQKTKTTTQVTPQQQTAVNSTFMPNGAPVPAPTTPTYAPAVQQSTTNTNTGTVNAQGVYTPGTAPNMQYTPQAVQQFQAPNTGQIGDQTQQMVSQLLNNPYSLSPQVLSQMKGQLTDQAALLNRQSMGALKQQLAGRGIASNFGYGLGQQRAVDAQTNRDILNNNRALDLQAAQQNRQDLLSAIGVGNQFQDSAMNRALSGYQAQLAGLGANRDEATTAIQSALQQYNAGLQGQQLASQSTLGSIGNQLQQQSINNQNSQFGQSLDLQNRQFDWTKDYQQQQLGLQGAAQSAANSQWADQMAFQYQKAQQDEFNGLLAYLMGGY